MKSEIQERRRHYRRRILDSFSFFVTIPAKGSYQLNVHDLSEAGIGFDYDLEGERLDDSPLQLGDSVDLQFFLNQSLGIQLKVRVAAIRMEGNQRRVGAEFIAQASPGYQALQLFLKLVDEFHRLGIFTD